MYQRPRVQNRGYARTLDCAAMDLSTFARDFARGMEQADAMRPQARSSRSGLHYLPGLGPHTQRLRRCPWCSARSRYYTRKHTRAATSRTWPADPLVEAFELLAAPHIKLDGRCEAIFGDLIHPVHKHGRVVVWGACPEFR